MKEKIKDAALKTIGYLIAGVWLVGTVVIHVLVIAGAIKIITVMFGG